MDFADLHVHNTLPILGPCFGRFFHDFDLGRPCYLGKTLLVASVYQLCFRGQAADEQAVREDICEITEQHQAAILRSKADYAAFLADPQRSLGLVLSLESLRPCADLKAVERFIELGVRILQPLHFWDNRYGNSYRLGLITPSEKGLTALGKELLVFAAERQLPIDIAHMNRASMEEVLVTYAGPVLCSHTGLTELNNTTRNLPGAVAKEIFARKGIVGITPWKRLLPKLERSDFTAWIEAYVDTICAFAKLGGAEGIAIGSDRGAPFLISPEFFQAKGISLLQERLAQRGLGPEFFQGFLARNAERFFQRTLS